jgi:hypothetical protein
MRSPLVVLLSSAMLAACADAPTQAVALDPASATRVSDAAANGNVGTADASEVLYALTTRNELLVFASSKPNQTTAVIAITGLTPGESVVGIDFRPSDLGANGVNDVGKLYAVTSESRLYVVNPETGAATSPVSLSIALDGTAFGVGFNPAADRLRIHSNTNQNLRINVETGATILDGALAYTAGDINATNDPDLIATAYTNNDANPATGTDLFAIDARQDVLVTFGPATPTTGPNSGKLLTVGALGVDAGMLAGFDISNATGVAYAVIGTSASDKSTLYTIDLASGTANKLGLLAQTKGMVSAVVVRP